VAEGGAVARVRQLLTGVIAIGATTLALAGAGAADTSVTTPYVQEAFNDCEGELVDLQGVMHTTEGTTVDVNGTHFHVTVNLSDVKGVAPLTGARYIEVLTQTQTANFTFDGASEQTGVLTQLLNRHGEDGTLDDFFLHVTFHVTVNANGVPTVDRTRSDLGCR
jgi:hypothetical protein